MADQELARHGADHARLIPRPAGSRNRARRPTTIQPRTTSSRASSTPAWAATTTERVGDDLERLAVSTGDFRPADDDTTSVSHEVVLAPDVDTAITAMAEVSVDGAESCISDVIGDASTNRRSPTTPT